MKLKEPVHIIGGGLAGSEAAWQIATTGVPVTLHEMRPFKKTAAHYTGDLAELVCSNSFRSDDYNSSAIGLLHEEMRRCGSLIMEAADKNKIPAGGALAVDRNRFSKFVTRKLVNHPNVTIIHEEVTELPLTEWNHIIIATGPLTSEIFANSIAELFGHSELAFFDAIAPIVHREMIDFEIAWFQSRYDKKGPIGDGKDYINCPLNKQQYYEFINLILAAEKTEFREWERDTPYFEGCLPIEVMAERGIETLRHGPMKPVGLTNPRSPNEKPYAVVQLRQDNALGTLYNMVGFQTKLKHNEQVRVFRTIPGLKKATFARLGGIHRNTFINSPELLDSTCRFRTMPKLRFAGQITGVEGYVESAAIGLLCGIFTAAAASQLRCIIPPPTTALGALINHITTGADAKTFQPMNANFGLFPPLDNPVQKKERKAAYAARAFGDLTTWLSAQE